MGGSHYWSEVEKWAPAPPFSHVTIKDIRRPGTNMLSGSMEDGDRIHSGPQNRRNRLKAEVIPTAPVKPQGEVHLEGNYVVGSFYLPELEPGELKYHIGRRTLTIWSRKEGVEFQSILVLPRWVRPPSFILSHKNGLYEFFIETEPGRSLPPAT